MSLTLLYTLHNRIECAPLKFELIHSWAEVEALLCARTEPASPVLFLDSHDQLPGLPSRFKAVASLGPDDFGEFQSAVFVLEPGFDAGTHAHAIAKISFDHFKHPKGPGSIAVCLDVDAVCHLQTIVNGNPPMVNTVYLNAECLERLAALLGCGVADA